MRIDELGQATEDDVRGLADLLAAVVADGGAVGFLTGLSVEEAATWWRSTLPDPAATTWVARDDDGVIGCVRLVLATMPNGANRADIAKMLVHPRARRRGLARTLLATAEAAARARGRTLLVLDTVPGTPAAALYRGQGWQLVGLIPDYAALPDGTLAPTAVFYKRLTD